MEEADSIIDIRKSAAFGSTTIMVSDEERGILNKMEFYYHGVM
jgi:hypothetical protein